MTILNARRLRDYPRLMLISTWLILALNLIFKQGWMGGLNQIIGSDFITLYAAGLAYRTDVSHLYDINSQYSIQQALVQPTQLLGVNPYISPPYVAQAYSLFTYLPLLTAFIIWTFLSLGFALLAGYLCFTLLPEKLSSKISLWQLWIIMLSFFPFIEGLQVGQNHTLTLLLITSILIFSLTDRPVFAGIMSGLLIYKPQFVIGFILIWIVWRNYKAMGAFFLTTIIWAGSSIILYGFGPYKSYLAFSKDLLSLPYVEGFPGYLLTTIYGFLATIFPNTALSITSLISYIFTLTFLIFFVWLAYQYRNKPITETSPVLILAILFPILAFPYSLLHDLLILVLAFILWTRYFYSRTLLYVAVAVYLGCFILTLIDTLTKIALIPLIPLLLTVLVIFNYFASRKQLLAPNSQ